MAHYAILDANNIVTSVFCGREDGLTNWEAYYGAKRTSYNTHGGVHSLGKTPFRKNYAGIGYTYDPVRDAFIPPKPTQGVWALNETSCLWEPVI